MQELAKILNKIKQFLSPAHGSWTRNEEHYLGKFSGVEFGHNSIFQGCEVFRDWETKPLKDFLIKLKRVTKKQFFSLHSFPSPTSHRSSWPLFCPTMSMIALLIPKNVFKIHQLRWHMEVGPKHRNYAWSMTFVCPTLQNAHLLQAAICIGKKGKQTHVHYYSENFYFYFRTQMKELFIAKELF